MGQGYIEKYGPVRVCNIRVELLFLSFFERGGAVARKPANRRNRNRDLLKVVFDGFLRTRMHARRVYGVLRKFL